MSEQPGEIATPTRTVMLPPRDERALVAALVTEWERQQRALPQSASGSEVQP